MSRRLCFALDLVDDAAKIAEYERFHDPGGVWPWPRGPGDRGEGGGTGVRRDGTSAGASRGSDGRPTDVSPR